MKLTFLQKDSKDAIVENESGKPFEHVIDTQDSTPVQSQGQSEPERPPYLLRNWVPVLTVGMALTVLVSSASVMNRAIKIADDLGKVTTDPISVCIVSFVAIALVIIQMVIGIYHFCHFRFSKLPRTSYINWAIVYLALMTMACVISIASMRNGLHRHTIGFSLVYFSIADAAYLFLTSMTLILLCKE